MTDTVNQTQKTYGERESWLQAATAIMRPWFVEIGFPIPEKLRIAVGFGPDGARAENATILGVCLHTSCSADKVNEIWISPEHASTGKMLGTLIHELIHAALNNQDGHRGRFAEAAVKLGLSGKMTATTVEGDLLMKLEMIAASLGEYPGAQVDITGILEESPVGPDGKPVPAAGGGRISSGPAKQKARMIKVQCETDFCRCAGYTVRTTRTWLDMGLPKCPEGNDMVEQN